MFHAGKRKGQGRWKQLRDESHCHLNNQKIPMLDKVPSSMGEEGRTSEHVWHISSLKHPFLPPFIMEWEPEKGSTAAPLCLKGSSCVLFSLKGSGWRVLRNRLYRSVLNWKWEEAWDKWLMGVKVIGKKTPIQWFFSFSSCTDWSQCCSSSQFSGSLPEPLGAYRYNSFPGGLYQLQSAQVCFSGCNELCLYWRTELIPLQTFKKRR